MTFVSLRLFALLLVYRESIRLIRLFLVFRVLCCTRFSVTSFVFGSLVGRGVVWVRVGGFGVVEGGYASFSLG